MSYAGSNLTNAQPFFLALRDLNSFELAQIAPLIDAGKVKPKVAKTFPLSSAARALETVEHGHSEGKIVLTVD
jgi:NADPH:quinone reductase-like Zn-dependent oxidoreductase